MPRNRDKKLPSEKQGLSAVCPEKLRALSDQTRFGIISALMKGPATVSELLKSIPIEQNLMSHHLKVLRNTGLVKSQRQGKGVQYELTDQVHSEGPDAIDLGCCRLVF